MDKVRENSLLFPNNPMCLCLHFNSIIADTVRVSLIPLTIAYEPICVLIITFITCLLWISGCFIKDHCLSSLMSNKATMGFHMKTHSWKWSKIRWLRALNWAHVLLWSKHQSNWQVRKHWPNQKIFPLIMRHSFVETKTLSVVHSEEQKQTVEAEENRIEESKCLTTFCWSKTWCQCFF